MWVVQINNLSFKEKTVSKIVDKINQYFEKNNMNQVNIADFYNLSYSFKNNLPSAEISKRYGKRLASIASTLKIQHVHHRTIPSMVSEICVV